MLTARTAVSHHSALRFLLPSSSSLTASGSQRLKSTFSTSTSQTAPQHGNKAKKRVLGESIAGKDWSRVKAVSNFDALQNVLDSPRGERGDQRGRDRENGRGDRRKEWTERSPGTSRYGSHGRPPRQSGQGRRPAHLSAGPTSYPSASTTPYMFSQKVHKWIDAHNSPLTPAQTDEIVDMVQNAPSGSVNAAVYNLVLALLGREKKYTRMWKCYNSMKKRRVHPTSRTYTTLLNAYAGISHSGIQDGAFTPASRPERLTLDRVRVIFEQSQVHIRHELARSKAAAAEAEAEADVGYAHPSSSRSSRAGRDGDAEPELDDKEINVRPTNAYLKFLGRFGLWAEMQHVLLSMDRTGPLAPDQATFYTMLKAANNIDHYKRANAGNPKAALGDVELELGPVARQLFDQAVRQLCREKGAGSANGDRKLDEALALASLQCFSISRPEDQRLAEQLVSRLWGLPAPGAPVVASSSSSSSPTAASTSASGLPSYMQALPTFQLTLKSATALLSLLGKNKSRTSSAAHYTHLILERPRLQSSMDLPFLRVAVHNLASARDTHAAMSVLENYQPPTGKDGWPVDVHLALLSAARWSRDWDVALNVFRRMVQLPAGVEDIRPDTGRRSQQVYTWTPPNGRQTDSRGKRWIQPRALPPTAESLSELLNAAVSASIGAKRVKPVRQALAVWWHCGGADTLSGGGERSDSSVRAEIARGELAKALISATEGALENYRDEEERRWLLDVKAAARAVGRD